MTTASVLMTVTTTWGSGNEKLDKEKEKGRPRNVAEVAGKELRETSAIKEQALRIMRDWIKKNNDIRNVRTDDAYLLRFLRQKKYSIPMAQQTLLKYLNLRRYYLEYFSNLDCEEPRLEEIFSNGFIVVSPVRDINGRRVIIYTVSKFDAQKFHCWDMCRAQLALYESLMDDETDQVCGYLHIGDCSGVTTGHVTSWNPSDFARLVKWGEQSLPMRHKEFHLVKAPTTFKYIIDFAVTRISPKMGERINVHSNFKQLHSKVDMSCLPTEFGGPLEMRELINYTKRLLSDQRKKVLASDDMELLSTKGIITSRNRGSSDLASVQGSFRKLEID